MILPPVSQTEREALEAGKPLRALELGAEDAKRLRGFQFLSAKPLLIVLNLDEAQLTGGGDLRQAADAAGLGGFLSRGSTAAVAVSYPDSAVWTAWVTARRERSGAA